MNLYIFFLIWTSREYNLKNSRPSMRRINNEYHKQQDFGPKILLQNFFSIKFLSEIFNTHTKFEVVIM